MISRSFAVVFVLSVSLVLTGSLPAQAEPGTGAGLMVLGGEVGRQLLDRAKDNADAVVAKLAARLDALLTRARMEYSDALSETIDQMEGEQRRFFLGLRDVIAEAELVANDVARDADDLAKQLNQSISQIPFARWGLITDVEPNFYAPALLPGGELKVSISGNGFSELKQFTCSAGGAAGCRVEVATDGLAWMRLWGLSDSEKADQMRELPVTVSLQRDIGLIAGLFRTQDPIVYRIPMLRLPDLPIELEVLRVSEKEFILETRSRVSGKHKHKSGRSRHRSGCWVIRPKGERWKIDLSSVKYIKHGADDGKAWVDTVHSSDDALKVCYNVKPAEKHVRKGYVEYSIGYTEHLYKPRAVVDEENPIWSGELHWSNQTTVRIPAAEKNKWLVRGLAFWGDSFTYTPADKRLPIEVVDRAREEGEIHVRMRDPSVISALKPYGLGR